MAKKIGRSDIIGERGIAFIRQVALSMGYMFYETGGVEAGVDGYIEIRDTDTGLVSNILLQIQGKATESSRLPAETPERFEWPCRPLSRSAICSNGSQATGSVLSVRKISFGGFLAS